MGEVRDLSDLGGLGGSTHGWSPMLAKTARSLDGLAWRDGLWAAEPKWDGYRAVVTDTGDRVRITSRQGNDLTAGFPDLVEALAGVNPAGTVLDAEVVIWNDGRLDFAALAQRRRRPSGAAAAAARTPAHLLVFDVMAAAGTDVRHLPLRDRRALLEQLATEWEPPLQLTPQTTRMEEARDWFAAYAASETGVEGLVCKKLSDPYRPGYRGWWKVRIRHTHDVVVGAVTGTAARPVRLVLGAPDRSGRLRIIGATSPLKAATSRSMGERLAEADPEHPWPQKVSARTLGSFETSGDGVVTLSRVVPNVVVEVSADPAFEHGHWRHQVRLVRVRDDLAPADVTYPEVG